ncbi:MAG: DUF4959 domain-containing protein [Tannerella sp.]|jgi:hypothetical protein|nr:DUF4959 domain-containing protein [Tannerella sp.]
MKKVFYLLVIGAILVFVMNGCAELPNYDDVRDNVAPGKVTVIQQEKRPGGVVIRYAPPEDEDVLGVLTRYSLREDSEPFEVYTSIYADSIVLEGFADTAPRKVQLFTVDKSNNLSEPLDVEVLPGTSPLEIIRQSLTARAGFGSVIVSWTNPTHSIVGVFLTTEDDSTGLAIELNYYSNVESGYYTFRNTTAEEQSFSNEERNFRIQIKDRWGNFSVPLDTLITPNLEIQIPGMNGITPLWIRYGESDGSNKWRGDFPGPGNNNRWEFLYDGTASSFFAFGTKSTYNTYLSNTSEVVGKLPADLAPMYFTIDLGRSVVLSRHKLWHDKGNALGGQNFKKYELWATNETPKQSEDFADQLESLRYWTIWEGIGGTDAWKNDWIKIADCETIPVSGATAPTAADKEYAEENGFEFEIYSEHAGTPFRYIRVVSPELTWGGNSNVRIGEFEFWGAYANE